MKEPFTWEALRLEADALEISVAENDVYVCFRQRGSGQYGTFGKSLLGCQAAAIWLTEIRQAIDIRDHLRSLELPRRRRMGIRYLWRR